MKHSIATQVKQPLPRASYQRNAEIYKLFSNPKRLEILNLLCEHELCVEDLVKITGLSKANISQHLALLRHARLVMVRRQGVNAFYRITHPSIVTPCRILHRLWDKKLSARHIA